MLLPMNYALTYIKNRASFTWVTLAIAAMILAYEPVLWLGRTWADPSYESSGFIVFCICAALFIWSVSSERITCKPVDKRLAISLVVTTSLIRLIGQVFAVNVIGAVALVIDVYAIGKLSALSYRRNPISAGWLAICFAFSLPLERIIQRTIGYGLQNISADGACSILGSMFDNVTCSGIRILLNNQDVLVDLPCSGARAILLLLLFYCACMSISRPTIMKGIIGLGITIISAIAINIFRIVILAIGIAYPDIVIIDVMAAPYHDIIGLIALSLGCIPIIIWTHLIYKTPEEMHPVLDQIMWLIPECIKRDSWWIEKSKPKCFNQKIIASVFLIFAVVIVSLPRTAIDVSSTDISIELPPYIGGEYASPVPLLLQEQVYFTKYGGTAKKAQYGNHNLMLVRTSAPLRHLHAPPECLRGLGFDVEYIGVNYATIPTAIYKATDSDGKSWRVAVSFISDDGKNTTNVSEAVWHWLNNRNSIWTAIQRISPWDMPEIENNRWDIHLKTALNINTENKPIYLTYKGENHD